MPVLYIPEPEDWRQVCERMICAGFRVVMSFNPYWERQRKTFCDPDGYRVVLQNGSWPVTP